MKLLQELKQLFEEKNTDWQELFAKTEDVTGGKGNTITDPTKDPSNSYRHKIYQDSDYQLWYFTVEGEEGKHDDLETFVAFYLGKAYFLGPLKTVVLNWVEHGINEGDWHDISEHHHDVFDGGMGNEQVLSDLHDDGDEVVGKLVRDQPMVNKIKAYIAALKHAQSQYASW